MDERHHMCAFMFEQVMRQVKAKYTLGLTAAPDTQRRTPFRVRRESREASLLTDAIARASRRLS